MAETVRDRIAVIHAQQLKGGTTATQAADWLATLGALVGNVLTEIRESEADYNLDPRKHLLGVRATLLGQPGKALPHRLEPALHRARGRVVERNPTTRGRDDLRDSAAHLTGADDQDVLDLHEAGT